MICMYEMYTYIIEAIPPFHPRCHIEYGSGDVCAGANLAKAHAAANCAAYPGYAHDYGQNESKRAMMEKSTKTSAIMKFLGES